MSEVSKNTHNKTLITQYIFGFILSIVLTLAAYTFATRSSFSGWYFTLALVGLAAAQLLVQLVFFLHVGNEDKPRLNLRVFMYMSFLLFFFVVGTLWIMKNLNYNMMTPSETDRYILHDEGR